MKCSKCHKKNISKANYCQKCGKKFTDNEKTQNDSVLVVLGKIIKKIVDVVTLNFITDHPVVRIMYVLVVFLIGVYMVMTMGFRLRIIDGKLYDVRYNDDSKTYYVFVDNNNEENEQITQIDLQLYIPNRINKLDLTYFDEENNLISEEKYAKKDRITLNVNIDDNNYYIINDGNNKKDRMKVYVYYGDVLNKGVIDNEEKEG